MSKAYFITGIDTDAGKTYATAFLAQRLMDKGKSVITQKFIQTGCDDASEDILKHRELLGSDLLPVDIDHTTAPVIFHHPCSPQLAARIDGREIDLSAIDSATQKLLALYDVVLIEGAGGLMVPISDEFLTADYIASRNLPAIVVTNGKLGSINHTILTLEAISRRNITLAAVVYNTHFDTDPQIADDTRHFIERYLARHHPDTQYLIMEQTAKAR
ncbi:MAG: dethiobiotin synthase [Muribaculaceae bacterium]